jgi:hypothetical protein
MRKKSVIKRLPALATALALLCLPAPASPKFTMSDIPGPASDLIACDLDGDGLKDIVLLDGMKLAVFHQDPAHGFSAQPQQTFLLDNRPFVVWPAKLNRAAANLLVMDADGVSELSSGRLQRIILQPTIIPAAAQETNAVSIPMSVETGAAWPLILVPAADGIHVWQHRDQWRQAQVIGPIRSALWPSLEKPGYDTLAGFDFSVGPGNNLVVRRRQGMIEAFNLYPQQSSGLFAPHPSLTYSEKVHPFSWLCWADLNHDGRMDLIKSRWLNEGSFLPGVPSGKVLVETYLADAKGAIPANPNQVF